MGRRIETLIATSIITAAPAIETVRAEAYSSVAPTGLEQAAESINALQIQSGDIALRAVGVSLPDAAKSYSFHTGEHVFKGPKPAPAPGELVFCTRSKYWGCSGSWLKEAGGDPATYDGGFLLRNVRTNRLVAGKYIDDSSYCSAGTARFVKVTANGSPQCVREWVNYYHAKYPKDSIYAGVNPQWGVRQRFPGSVALLEMYYAMNRSSNTTPCGYQGGILPRYFKGTAPSGTPLFNAHPNPNKFIKRWNSAVACKPASVLAYY